MPIASNTLKSNRAIKSVVILLGEFLQFMCIFKELKQSYALHQPSYKGYPIWSRGPEGYSGTTKGCTVINSVIT